MGGAVALLTAVRVGSVFAGFLASVVGARLIGADGLGIVGAATTAATIGALATNGGINIATVYFLGQRPSEATRIVGWVSTIGGIAALLAAIVTLGAGMLLGDMLVGDVSAGVLISTAMLAAGILAFELGGGVLLGLHARTVYITVQIVEAVGSLVMTVAILALVSRTPAGFLAAAAAGYWLGLGMAAFAVSRRIGRIRLGLSRPFLAEALAVGLRGQAGNVLQFLNLRLDLLLVPALLNLTSAGVYLIAVRISEVVTQVASSAATFLFPHVASQATPSATFVTQRTVRFTLLFVCATGLLLAVTAEVILDLFFGPNFTAGASTVRITLLAMVPLAIARLLAGDLKGRGRPGLVSIAASVALGVTIVGNLLLIPTLGIVGAALASLLSYSASAALLLAAYRRVTGASILALLPRTSDLAAILSIVHGYLPTAAGRTRRS